MSIRKSRPGRGGLRDRRATDQFNSNGWHEPIVVTELSQSRGGRSRSLNSAVTNTLSPAVLPPEIGSPAPGKPAGQRTCRKCRRKDRKFSGRHTLCNHCRTPASPPRWCECGALLGTHQRKCDLCRLVTDPASSQCPFCLRHYWTHRGMRADRSEMRYHALAQCIKPS